MASRTTSAALAGSPRCHGCRHFLNDPQEMERLFPGLASFSSGSASVRADDGLCRRHDRYLRATDHCPEWQAREKDGQHSILL